MGKSWFQYLFVLVICGVLSACSKPARQDLPSWYSEFSWLKGANLFHVVPWNDGNHYLTQKMINNPAFVQNAKGLRLNAFRVPISWNHFASADGTPNPAQMRAGLATLKLLVSKMEQICSSVQGQTVPAPVPNLPRSSTPASSRNPAASAPEEWFQGFQWNDGKISREKFREKLDQVQGVAARSPAAVAPTSGATPINRCLLILDFHQFLLGPQCGGDGIPVNAMKSLPLVSTDPNCLFKGFEGFWNNTDNVQSSWINFAADFIKMAHEEFRLFTSSSTVTVAIEPINEPIPGSNQSLIVAQPSDWNLSVLELVRKLDQSLNNLGAFITQNQPTQIPRLITFYKNFLSALDTRGVLKAVSASTLFVFEPFLTDYSDMTLKKWQLGVLPAHDIVTYSEGNYSAMKDLQYWNGTPLYWLAGPHQYYGAFDVVFLRNFPDKIVKFLRLNEFPNRYFGPAKMADRLTKMEAHFRTLGMETILGEYGAAQTLGGGFKAQQPIEGFTFERDTPGWQAWIAINNLNALVKLKGALWWRYNQEYNDAESDYYLLRSKNPNGSAIGETAQLLKCRSGYPNNLDLVPAVFFLNSSNDCPQPAGISAPAASRMSTK